MSGAGGAGAALAGPSPAPGSAGSSRPIMALTRANAGRRGLGALLVVATLAVVACAPPPQPPPPSGPMTTTTVLAPPSGCGNGGSTGQATSTPAASGSASAEDLPILTGSDEITTAAEDAVRDARATGANAVTVIAVDDTGRPTMVPAPLGQAVDVALATAEDLDVVAVEAPSYATALEFEDAGVAAGASPDPDVDRQWAHQAFAFSDLWPTTRGAGITVAVVDTGVQANHPDLDARVLPGAAFVSGTLEPGGGATDVNGHGTHVAGIIGAGENGVGVVGVAPEVTILPVRVLNASGIGPNSGIAAGITWAVDHGAVVINVSIGSDTNSAAVAAAVNYATNHGIVVVAAAGNNHQVQPPADDRRATPPRWPTRWPWPRCRTRPASRATRQRGAYVDVAAPGSNIYSTKRNSTWGNNSGTSMASPSRVRARRADHRRPRLRSARPTCCPA